jgi:hypothetical protein
MDWNMVLNNDQVWTLVIGVLFALSEILGCVKRGPNGILHAVWKFYNLKVELEYDEDAELNEREELQRRVDETLQPNRESVVLENSKATGQVISPNVLLVNK